jgi:hypothetical protein
MIGIVSFITIVLGGVTASIAERFPARIEALETCAGVLLVGGLALLGSSLPVLL